MEIHFIKDEGAHEFEKPLCLTTENESIAFAVGQIGKASERISEDIKKTMDALMAKHREIGKTLLIQLEIVLKEQGKWPKDWRTNDHLMIEKGVIYQARCNGGHK